MLSLLIQYLFKSVKMTTHPELYDNHNNNNKNYNNNNSKTISNDYLFKVSIIINLFLTCSKFPKVANIFLTHFIIIIIVVVFFFQHRKFFFFVETYNNGKPHNARTKGNCRK